MNESEMDQTLEKVFQAAFHLTEEQETVFYRRFMARQQEDQYAWAAFTAVMVGLNVRLRPAMHYRRWPLRRQMASA